VLTPSPQPLALLPDLDQARRFLTALDSSAHEFCFQSFADRGRNRTLARTLHGSLDELAPTLVRLNQQGAGIFVAVNEIEVGKPRKIEHVTRGRALFADADDPATLPKVEAAIANFGLPPSMTVETSPGKRHFYWFTGDCPLDRFTEAQKALAAALVTDPAVCDLPRVMRVPGFLHMKREPFLVRLVVAP
jgi:hypothetical protein